MKLITIVFAVGIVLVGCGHKTIDDPIINSISALKSQSTEMKFLNTLVQGQTCRLALLHKPEDSSAFLLMRCTQNSGYFDYRYEIGADSIVELHVPDDASFVMIGVSSPTRLLPDHGISSMVFQVDGKLAFGAISGLLADAASYADALHIAHYAAEHLQDPSALLNMLTRVPPNSAQSTEIKQLIESSAIGHPTNHGIALAAEVLTATTESGKAATIEFLRYWNEHAKPGSVAIFESVVSHPTLIASLDVGIVDTLLVPVLQRHGLWSTTRTISYSVKQHDTARLATFAHLAKAYCSALPSMSDYLNVHEASVKYTFAEIAHAYGDTSTAYRLLENIITTTCASADRYHRSALDPYVLTEDDSRRWAREASVNRRARWALGAQDYVGCTSALARYVISNTTGAGQDASAIRMLATLSKKVDVGNIASAYAQQISQLDTKMSLRDTMARYFPSMISLAGVRSTSTSTDIVMISSNTCSVCRKIIRHVREHGLRSRRTFTVINVDNSQVEYSSTKAESVSRDRLIELARSARAFPTLFILRKGQVDQKIEGASIELVEKLARD